VRTDGQTDGQTHMTELIVAFRSFANAPKEKKEGNPQISFAFSNSSAVNCGSIPVHLTKILIQACSNMTGTNCDLFTHNQSRSLLNHLVFSLIFEVHGD
jgi:hypothetical protein